MKKLLSILIIAVLAAPLASAQISSAEQPAMPEPKPAKTDYTGHWEIGTGLSSLNYINLMFIYLLTDLGHALGKEPIEDGRENDPELGFPGNLNITPRYYVNRWLSVGANLSLEYMSDKVYNSDTDKDTGVTTQIYRGMHSMGVVAIMPCVRFNYMTKPKCTLYGEAQAGVASYFFDEHCNGGSDLDVVFSFQVTPIGVTFGSKVFGFAEVGAGWQWIGGQLGIGYRF